MYVANYHGPDDGTNSTGAGASVFKLGADCKLSLTDFVGASGEAALQYKAGILLGIELSFTAMPVLLYFVCFVLSCFFRPER